MRAFFSFISLFILQTKTMQRILAYLKILFSLCFQDSGPDSCFSPCFRIVVLRTAPTKYKGFCARLVGPRGKSRSLQGLLESTKENGDSYAFCFEIISQMLTSAFSEKRRKG